MHPMIVLATAPAAHPAWAAQAGAVATGAIVATAVFLILKVIARILLPKRKTAAPAPSPYAAPARRR